ncbi:lysophospholipase [Achromobacter sp. Marseille-Q4962]|uniref:alpha/beta fold hydrolase n=1 Tax=Achromobacter sp. Marseille-Q4962 TaxID=2942202 RepID=UPI002072C225|nr:lysophospholipase [Achromobacter sp. Marseille-Q4962]
MADPMISPARPTLLFVHGWAFDARFWDGLRLRLGDWPHAVADAGYYGAPVHPRPDGPVVAIGHSLGVLRLLETLPPRCAGLVSINGFARFGGGPGFPQGVPRRLLDRMLARLAAEPEAAVREFRQRCGADGPGGAPRAEALAGGLQALRDLDLRHALDALPVPLLALAGGADPIAPPALTQAAFAARPAAELQWLPEGGHLLPATHAPWCAQHIRAFLARLARP